MIISIGGESTNMLLNMMTDSKEKNHALHPIAKQKLRFTGTEDVDNDERFGNINLICSRYHSILFKGFLFHGECWGVGESQRKNARENLCFHLWRRNFVPKIHRIRWNNSHILVREIMLVVTSCPGDVYFRSVLVLCRRSCVLWTLRYPEDVHSVDCVATAHSERYLRSLHRVWKIRMSSWRQPSVFHPPKTSVELCPELKYCRVV